MEPEVGAERRPMAQSGAFLALLPDCISGPRMRAIRCLHPGYKMPQDLDV